MSSILPRKIISASISSTLLAVILGLLTDHPSFFVQKEGLISDKIFSLLMVIPIYLMFSFPVILVYGVLTSILSDKIGEKVSIKFRKAKIEPIVSGILHFIFGMILLYVSLIASMLFFITDRILRRGNRQYVWKQAVQSFILPALTWLICMGIEWGRDLFFN
ncbi:hypothetical protein [Rubeoparvulum massiliense]|uniref:hypothetical protein n=1 Tax=Rubeoparvulum massiliense TaxID=1631346 RepID=UPI00065DCF78|nr:hypothetical protein [Rubeoparvulum massiliense]